MNREKMPRSARAKQFLPFDSVKGLKEAIKAKEYECEKVSRGYLLPEEATRISNLLLELHDGDLVEAKVYVEGHYVMVSGKVKTRLDEGYIIIGEKRVDLSDLYGLSPQN